MTAYPRAELEEMVQRWLQANKDAEAANDWKPMADLYTEDATYGWNYGAHTDFMAVGREQIREYALGEEMEGLDGWEYPYEEIVIDEQKGMVIGFWRQIADATREDGSRYEIAGIGGSWFIYGGNHQWRWQRDWFDFGNAASLFMDMMGAGVLSDGMVGRMNRSMQADLPGYYPHGKAPVNLWEGRS
ncbi:MAG: nuclear transport factor 2 family protein [Acidimicrobiales bacterium]